MKIEVTKKDLFDLIHQTGRKIDELLNKLSKQEKVIADLEAQNNELKHNNQTTLSQIKEYIQELEQIRNTMSIVTIVLNGKDFKLACSEESKDRLVMLSQKLDTEIKEMAAANQYASLELLLVMMSLKHIDQRQSQMQVSGGEILESANLDFQKQLSSIFSELKIVAEKLEKH
jgi:cell division protein ZapA (FtsZ GTPase activity inhibitor)